MAAELAEYPAGPYYDRTPLKLSAAFDSYGTLSVATPALLGHKDGMAYMMALQGLLARDGYYGTKVVEEAVKAVDEIRKLLATKPN